MKTIPILFSTEMVKAILEGKKTQTRRIIKPQPNFDSAWKNHGTKDFPEMNLSGSLLGVSIEESGTGCCVPNVKIKVHKNDIFWVRETFQYSDDFNNAYLYKQKEFEELELEYFKRLKWKPSIFMPKEACRLFLKVTNVRIERLQNISEQDAYSEGINMMVSSNDDDCCLTAKEAFQSLWESINGKESWSKNPFVWVYEFDRSERPLNFA